VAVNRNKVLFFHSTHSLHVSARTGHLQVNIIVSYEASYARYFWRPGSSGREVVRKAFVVPYLGQKIIRVV
jgi:hypothetical protein